MENASNVDPNLRCEYALRVALQTMKERCVALQRRLTTVEEENHELRERFAETSPAAHNRSSGGSSSGVGKIATGAAENLQLRLQVAELTREKAQLSEHISMVSNENRKLWSRLSQIAKEQINKQNSTDTDNDCIISSEAGVMQDIVSTSRTNSGGENQNLIRSKTFTKHSPNPHLRPKLIESQISKDDELSLEEVALNAYEDNNVGAGEDFADADDAQLRFGFLKVDETASNDALLNLEAKKCIEGLQEIRREAMKQQHDLHSALAMLESRIALHPCPECAQKVTKPEMADKSLETDESLNELKMSYSQKQHEKSNNYNGTEPSPAMPRLNVIQEKIQADALDKTCPMCGKIYNSLVSFDAFREHVELHFIDESNDIEASMERNFEFISHAVGDF